MNIAAFLSYAVIANLSPGPNTILSMSHASRYRWKKGLQFNLGVAAGVFLVLLLCGIFSLTLFRLFPQFQQGMVWVGAGYILWLAWKTYRSGPVNGQKEERAEALFFQGFLLQFANPNTVLYGLTVLSTFVVPYYGTPLPLTLFCLLLSLFALLGTACWTLFGSVFQKVVIAHSKGVNNILAALLVYCAISLII